jgi:rSAM/selenodomain-associated transferase 1
MTTAIGVFTRAPVPGATKTRLIPLLGPEGAAQAHQQLLALALRCATQAFAGRATVFAAGAIDHPVLLDLAARHDAPLVAQQGADLGERMLNALTHLLQAHDQALVIGSDCAVLTPQVMQEAAARLQEHDMVFVPAEDGGYVLVGARRGAAGLPSAFDGIPWGTSDVMQLTRERLSQTGMRHAELAPLWDVDEPADWLRAVDSGLVNGV